MGNAKDLQAFQDNSKEMASRGSSTTPYMVANDIHPMLDQTLPNLEHGECVRGMV